jgi:hypothetical protein
MTIHTHHIINGVRVDLTPEEILEFENARIAHEANADTRKAVVIREERNTRLAASDWTQAADVPQSVKDNYAPYRQALRDVPQQTGFPESFQWPTKPE